MRFETCPFVTITQLHFLSLSTFFSFPTSALPSILTRCAFFMGFKSYLDFQTCQICHFSQCSKFRFFFLPLVFSSLKIIRQLFYFSPPLLFKNRFRPRRNNPGNRILNPEIFFRLSNKTMYVPFTKRKIPRQYL